MSDYTDPHRIDPHKISVESHLARPWEIEETFQDIMAEQLRHAPWLAISVLVHAIAVLILLSIPTTPKQQLTATPIVMDKPVEDVPDEQEEPEPPEEPEIPEPDTPEMQNTDVVADDQTQEQDETIAEDALDDFESFENALDIIGIGDGDLGVRGGRRGGRRGLGRSGRPIAKGIELGLKWLRRHQDKDGRWSSAEFMKHCPAHAMCGGPGNPVNDIGLTGLALLAFLGDGSTMRSGPYSDVVKAATIWLKEQQNDEGLIGTESGRQFMYNHAIAALALIESYGLSKYRTLRRYAQRSVDYICKARNPYKVWRYYPHDGGNDTSVTGWMVFALKSALDFKLKVDADALTYSLAWFDEVTDPATGQCGYQKRGEGSSREPGQDERFPANKSEAMTATGLLCRIFLKTEEQKKKGFTALEKVAADTVLKKPPVWNESDGSIDLYYWYYATYAMFQMGGRHWKGWKKHLETGLVRRQNGQSTGHLEGSWDPVSVWGHAGGRVYSTAIGVLCLESYYRYNQLIR